MTIPEQSDITKDELKDVFGWDPDAPEPTPIREAQEALTRRLTGPKPCVRTPGEDILKSIPGGYEFRARPVEEPEQESDTQAYIREVCDEFRDWLIAKNKQYGDSAIHPVRIFSSSSDEEQLLVRIDDKLSRLFRGNSDMEPDHDIMDDLLGYWFLLKVLRRKAGDDE